MSASLKQSSPSLNCGGRILDLSRPIVMGIINTTPDSFSDGGTLYKDASLDLSKALSRACEMVDAGARMLDVGGESTRPGAEAVSLEQELDRVLPLVEAIKRELDVVISVDTSSAKVMTEAASLGAGFINDVRALSRAGALDAAAATGLPICLMHMQGQPQHMQDSPRYVDVAAEVVDFLEERISACQIHGIGPERLVLDPGFGFGKTLSHNLQLVRDLPRLHALGLPILVGFSRKSMIGKLLGREVDERLPAGLALALQATSRGARIVRTHDVQATVDALAMWEAVEEYGAND
ncbi:MAG: dihydropteroate synthase [Halioglobus sp.]